MPATPTTPVGHLATLAETLKQAWRAGEAPDVVRALRDHPGLLRHRSLVVDLAYEEYCVREEAGDTPETEEFCGRLPAFRSHVREVIHGHRLLADHPELLGPAAEWPAPGDTFEQLTVVCELGRGAFARVYLARDPETGHRPVVLKLAPVRSGEARTLGNISHCHVVSVLWARQAGGLYAVCMPFVGAVTLRDAVEAEFRAGAGRGSAQTLLAATTPPDLPLPVPPAPVLTGWEHYPVAVARLAGRLADAAAYLHDAGIVHGDLKPSNVLLGPGGHPYLIDFNLSTNGEDSPRGGTLAYMAPERVRGMLGRGVECGPVAAGDVYSFGVVLFEALTGRVPFEPLDGPDAEAVAADILRRQTAAQPRPTAGRTSIPKPLATLIDRCLDPDPSRRPPMSRVKREIDRYLARRVRHRVGVGVGLIAASVAIWAAVTGTAPGAAPDVSDPATRTTGRPASADEYFARGVRHLKEGYVAPAMKDFDDANRLRPDGRNTAYLAYCQAAAGQHRSAAGLYKRAEVEYGFSPAWARSNRAFSLIQAGPTADRLREAVAEASAALALSPDLRPARLNRCYARFLLGLAEAKDASPDPEVLDDVEVVMRVPPYTAELYRKAAAMTVTFGAGRMECRPRAVAYLEEAVKLGQPARALGSDTVLRRHLGDRPDFARLLELPATPPANPAATPNPHIQCPPLD